MSTDIAYKRASMAPTSVWVIGAVLIGLLLIGSAPHPREFPSRPIHLLGSLEIGNGGDELGTYLAEHLSSPLGVPVRVTRTTPTNAPFALRSITAAADDGHLIGIMNSGSLLSSAIERGRFDPAEFRYLGLVQGSPLMLFVARDSPLRSYREFLQAAKTDPDGLRVATGGYQTLEDTAIRYLDSHGYRVRNVPYGPLAIRHLSATVSDTDALLEAPARVAALVESGQLRPLVVFQQGRHEAFPDVPASGEFGQPFGLRSWWALVAGPDVPEEVVATWYRALVRATGTSEWRDFCQRTLCRDRILTAEEARDFVLAQVERTAPTAAWDAPQAGNAPGDAVVSRMLGAAVSSPYWY